MANVRIVWDNAADRGSIAASSEAGNLTALNLRNNLKGKVWRGLVSKATIVCGWTEAEPVGMVCLAFNNFTSLATMTVKGYTRPESLLPEFTIGPVQGAPQGALGQFPWGAPMAENFYARGGASLFAYGYGGYATVWVPGGRAVRRLEITIDDPENPDGYLEAGRLIVGPYWEPLYNFDFNHRLSIVDSTQNRRTEGGDLRGEKSPRWRRVEFNLSNMDDMDRTSLLRIMRLRGVSEPILVSMFPESTDSLLEQAYQLWGKFEDNGTLTQPNFDVYSSPLAVEEM